MKQTLAHPFAPVRRQFIASEHNRLRAARVSKRVPGFFPQGLSSCATALVCPKQHFEDASSSGFSESFWCAAQREFVG